MSDIISKILQEFTYIVLLSANSISKQHFSNDKLHQIITIRSNVLFSFNNAPIRASMVEIKINSNCKKIQIRYIIIIFEANHVLDGMNCINF